MFKLNFSARIYAYSFLPVKDFPIIANFIGIWNGTSGLYKGFSGSKFKLMIDSMISPKMLLLTSLEGTCLSSSVKSTGGACPFGGAFPLTAAS